MPRRNSDVLIIIPAFNEEKSIGSTLNSITALGHNWDVLVVNDGSHDNTARFAEKCGAVVLNSPFNIGIGGAVSLGLLYAFRHGYQAVVRVDADGQHDCQYIKEILEPVLTGKADLSIGSRFIGMFQGYRSSFIRRIGINFFSVLISFLIREKITDPTSGFNAFSVRAVQLFSEYYPVDYPEPEAIVIAKRAGLRIREVPVQMRSRMAGVSSIRYLRTLYYMINVTLAIMLNYLRPKKTVKM
jgi:hypothetical protein